MSPKDVWAVNIIQAFLAPEDIPNRAVAFMVLEAPCCPTFAHWKTDVLDVFKSSSMSASI